MHRLLFICFCLIIPFAHLNAQIFPKDGDSLNFRIIGFSFPAEKTASSYKLEIAEGHVTSADVFSKHVIVTYNSKSNRLVGEVPEFGAEYTWRVSPAGRGENIRSATLHHFKTGNCPAVDTSILRFRVTQSASKYSDAYIFLDVNGVLYDMKGRPVWYLPQIDNNVNFIPKDIKVTPKGTITFVIDENNIYEINYKGEVLWKGPDNREKPVYDREHYHQSVTRLANGHYMTLCSESVWWDTTTYRADYTHYADSIGKANPDKPDPKIQLTEFGTVKEFDSSGKVVWTWRSGEYFKNSDFKFYKKPVGQHVIDVRENAFYFDEQRQFLYVNFQRINRIVKIKYPEGKVLEEFGETFKKGGISTGFDLFCGQNSIGITKTNKLFVANNNTCTSGLHPKLEVLEMPGKANPSLSRYWEYEYPTASVDTNSLIILPDLLYKKQNEFGGHMVELPDGEFLASLCSPFGIVFIVDNDKKIIWSAVAERWVAEEKKWKQHFQFRASIIVDKKALEQVIWNSEKDRGNH